jgi:5-methylthioadenosine/S-adenosylhomocysteine deaminase
LLVAEHKADLLIKDGLVVTVDPRDTILERCDVAVKGNRIVAIGPDLPHTADLSIDARGKAVLPGFVNVHMHETLLRGFCEDLPLRQWLEEICFPKDRAYLPEHAYAAALMNQLEMIRAGITTFIDIFRFPDQGAQVAEASGLRAILSPQIIETPAGAGETLESATEFVEAWRNRVPGRIYPWFGPHAAYSCSPGLFREVHERAEHHGVGVHTHLAETQWEADEFARRQGMSSVRWLDQLGVLGSNVLAAHCVAVSDDDIRILQQRDVAVAHNPTSNAKLASGIAPVLKMLNAGVRVGLGTDSNLSNNRLDMFAEIKMAALLQRLQSKDASALPCGRALRLATIDGARCLGLEADVGSLEVGKKADVILVDLEQPHLWPLLSGDQGNVIAQLVYAAGSSDVTTTIVDGKVLMRGRCVLTMDEDAAQDLVSSAARDLISRAAASQGLG